MNRVRGSTIADNDLLQLIKSKGRKIVVATPGSEEARFLDYFGANASVNTGDLNHIIVRPNVFKIEILEEFLHGTQQKLGIIEKLGNFGSEIHVKNFMIRHKKMLGLSLKDVQALKIMRDSYIEGGQW